MTSDTRIVESLKGAILDMLEFDNLSIDDLSQKMHMSKSHLHRVIKKNTGESTSLFIRNVKLKMASDLLRHSDRSISEIAYQCGFSRPQLLSRYFQESHGVSPSAYRAESMLKQHHIRDIESRQVTQGKSQPSDTLSIYKTIVIMPFIDKSETMDQNFLSTGISDEITHRLSQFSNLKITGRATSNYLAKMPLKPSEIGKKLNADFILNGSIKRSDRAIRINITLESIQDNELIWAERYEKELTDLFELEDEIADQIAQRMELALIDKGPSTAAVSRYENVEAYEAYLKGRKAFEKRDDLDIALTYFNQAVSLDDRFSKAHIGIAYVHFYKCIFEGAPPIESLGTIQSAYDSAVLIDKTIPEAFIIKGWIEFYFKHNTKRGLEALDSAIAAQPNLMDAYRIKAYFLCFSGKFKEGIALAKKAFDMDPLGFNAWFSYGDILRRARNYNEASETLSQLLIEYPNNILATEILGYCYLYSGNLDEAQKYFADSSQTPNHISLYVLGSYIYNFNCGDANLLPALLEELSHSDIWVQPTILALLNFYVGDEVQAMKHLKVAKRELDFGMKHIIADQHWDPYREHPAVQKILSEIGMV